MGHRSYVVEERDPAGGFLGSRLKKIDQILQSEPNAVWLNQYANIANKNVHAEQTANEIAREFDKVDWVFVGAGTTGTLAGMSERLRREFPRIKVVAVEPVGSVTFGGAPGKRHIPGIGTSVRPKLADLANPDRVVAVSEEKTVEACLSFVRDYHLLVGGSTGTVLAAVQQLAPEFTPGDTIVAISADLGDKYLDTVYDTAWVENVIASQGKTPVRALSRRGRIRRRKGARSWQPLRRSTLLPARQSRASLTTTGNKFSTPWRRHTVFTPPEMPSIQTATSSDIQISPAPASSRCRRISAVRFKKAASSGYRASRRTGRATWPEPRQS